MYACKSIVHIIYELSHRLLVPLHAPDTCAQIKCLLSLYVKHKLAQAMRDMTHSCCNCIHVHTSSSAGRVQNCIAACMRVECCYTAQELLGDVLHWDFCDCVTIVVYIEGLLLSVYCCAAMPSRRRMRLSVLPRLTVNPAVGNMLYGSLFSM